MTVVDLKFHGGDVFVAGVSNQEFSSTLRRIPYPFTGAASETHLEIYHLAHGLYETRAPIRTMQFANINGEDTLVAAYACSPLVTIPVSELKHGAKVRGKTIGDMAMASPSAWSPTVMGTRTSCSSPMSASVDTSKPAMDGQVKTGHQRSVRDW